VDASLASIIMMISELICCRSVIRLVKSVKICCRGLGCSMFCVQVSPLLVVRGEIIVCA
jgi:hypothetical protein